jgi:hypothetical protein
MGRRDCVHPIQPMTRGTRIDRLDARNPHPQGLPHDLADTSVRSKYNCGALVSEEDRVLLRNYERRASGIIDDLIIER